MAPVSINMNYISTRLSAPAFWLASSFRFLGFLQRKQVLNDKKKKNNNKKTMNLTSL